MGLEVRRRESRGEMMEMKRGLKREREWMSLWGPFHYHLVCSQSGTINVDRPSSSAFPQSNSLSTNGVTNMEIETLAQGSSMDTGKSPAVQSQTAVVPKVNPVNFMKGHAAEVSSL